MSRLALFGVLTLALTASAQDKKDVPKDLVPFQGTWKVVRVESDGKPLEKDPSGVPLQVRGRQADRERRQEEEG